MMLMRKKRRPHPLSTTIDQRPNQLLEPVSPFEEYLPPNQSVRFQKSFNFHRRHLHAREQLAKLKARYCLNAAIGADAETRDDPLAVLEGITPARELPTNKASPLSDPVKLKSTKGKSSSKLAKTNTTKTSGRSYLSSFRPPTIPSDIFTARCDGQFPMAAGACVAMPMPTTPDHEIPFIISITKLDEDEDDDDDNSEISIEDGLVYKSSSGIETEPTVNNSYSQTFTAFTAMTSVSQQSWSYPAAALAGMTKSCMPMTTSDLASSVSDDSISWPSDEEDGGDSYSEEDNDYISRDGFGRENSQQLITAVHDLNCDDGNSHYFKADIACGGFKFWSSGDDRYLLKNQVSRDETNNSSAARDDEDFRDKNNEKTREDVPETAASV